MGSRRMEREEALAYVRAHAMDPDQPVPWSTIAEATGVPKGTIQAWVRKAGLSKPACPSVPPAEYKGKSPRSGQPAPRGREQVSLDDEVRDLGRTALVARLKRLQDVDPERESAWESARIAEALARSMPQILATVRDEDADTAEAADRIEDDLNVDHPPSADVVDITKHRRGTGSGTA